MRVYWVWCRPVEYPARCLYCWGTQTLDIDERGPYAHCYRCGKEEEFNTLCGG